MSTLLSRCAWLRTCAVFIIGLTALAGSSRAEEIAITKDIPYKSGADLSEYEQTRCRLDLYAPAGAQKLPCLVWFHGGGMTGGDKAGPKSVLTCKALAGEGVLVVAANYRLSPKVKYPAYIEDAAAAVAWAKAHAVEHGGDPERVFVAGHSAGAYLTAMVALDSHYLEKHGVKPGNLAGFIPLSGQMMTHYTVREERGLPKTRIIADEAAPIYHVNAGTPPWLILYAEHDMTLRADENRYFAAALKAAGQKGLTVHEIAGYDHGGMGDRIPESDSPVRAAIVAFIRGASATAK